jgi:hypothetical protein
LQNKEYLETIRHFSEHDYNELNNGKSAKNILLEKSMFEKFGKE